MRSKDEKYIKLSLELAKKAKGSTSPNPCVGAVVVKDGKIVGTGYHKRAGWPHAEIYALREAGRKAKGATLYVSLEPCTHYGRTPPCVDFIISSGIKRVVAAMRDPNPLNNGRGLAILKRRGIKAEAGILADEAMKLNGAFVKYITKKMPFVTVKTAQSLDGKIATRRGDSKWISGEPSRAYSHRLRNESDAIMVGSRTVIKDDPLLTVRFKGKKVLKQPARIILDNRLVVPINARILNSTGGKVIVATTVAAPKKKIKELIRKGAEVLVIKSKAGRVDIKTLLRELAKREIANILIEGGGEVIASAFEARAVDKVIFFIAPKIIGGREAPTSVEGLGIGKMKDAIKLKETEFRKIGDDIVIEGYVGY